MSNSEQVAVRRRTFTESFTFVGKPSDERRAQLKAAGYKFENGQWYCPQTDSNLVTDEEDAKLLAA